MGVPTGFDVFHWGGNNTCAFAVDNRVYILDPSKTQSSDSSFDACEADYKVSCLKWMNPIRQLPAPQNCSVLAVATNCSQSRIALWECITL